VFDVQHAFTWLPSLLAHVLPCPCACRSHAADEVELKTARKALKRSSAAGGRWQSLDALQWLELELRCHCTLIKTAGFEKLRLKQASCSTFGEKRGFSPRMPLGLFLALSSRTSRGMALSEACGMTFFFKACDLSGACRMTFLFKAWDAPTQMLAKSGRCHECT